MASLLKGLQLEIATVLRDRRRTLYETAVAVGRRSGDIQRSLRQMHSEGVLEAEHEEPEAGTRFWLAPGYDELLADSLQAGRLPGLVQENQDLLLLNAPSRQALNAVFAQGDLAAVISWATRLGGATAMLVSVAPQATELDYNRLVSVLESQGVGVSSYRTAKVCDGDRLRAAAIASNQAVDAVSGGDAT